MENNYIEINNRVENKINQLCEDGYQLNMARYITSAFDLFFKQAGSYIGFLLIFLSINVVLSVIPFLGSLALFLLNACLTTGFAIYTNKIKKNETTDFGSFFKGFDFFGSLVLRNLIAGIIYIFILMIGVIYLIIKIGVSFISNPHDLFQNILFQDVVLNSLIFVLLLLPAIYLNISWIFADLIIVFEKKDFWQAMELSRKLITKKWFSFLGFVLLLGLINFLGAIALLVGLIITLPVTFIAIYMAYEDIIGTEN